MLHCQYSAHINSLNGCHLLDETSNICHVAWQSTARLRGVNTSKEPKIVALEYAAVAGHGCNYCSSSEIFSNLHAFVILVIICPPSWHAAVMQPWCSLSLSRIQTYLVSLLELPRLSSAFLFICIDHCWGYPVKFDQCKANIANWAPLSLRFKHLIRDIASRIAKLPWLLVTGVMSRWHAELTAAGSWSLRIHPFQCSAAAIPAIKLYFNHFDRSTNKRLNHASNKVSGLSGWSGWDDSRKEVCEW